MTRTRALINIISNVPPQMAVKMAVCAAAVLVLAYVVLVQGGQEAAASRGARAAEGIRMTSSQAEDMSHSADVVSELFENVAARQPADARSSTAGHLETDGGQVTFDDQYVRRVEELVNRWRPRYMAARADIDRFEHGFRTAEDRLMEYFKEQSELTRSVNDPELRAELLRRDTQERDAYERWTLEGSHLLSRALAMGRQLDDMDVVIRKQQLTVGMLSQYTRERSIPATAESLHASLSEFRLQSAQLASDLSTNIFN